ncbi:rotamase [Rhodovarius crocodyli]|uniref:Parvulin-like PPIase n=1 Tax=Rhodovarius crocodyli TaxID=1979269 RepID=A0A437MJ56_9PROT|nr:peptidylprolyl isomerase [Rhodovarius crocodyli]RVT97707.1 rotamase [Rhodovarius crocodyli]
MLPSASSLTPSIRLAAALSAGLSLLVAAPAWAQGRAPRPHAATEAPQPPRGNVNRILAVVNGDVVTQSEVSSRTRLFALNAGFAASGEMLARMEPQVLRLLVDEKLRMQEVQRRQIPVSDNDVADALRDIEQRNGLPRGALTAQLRQAGIQPRSLYDQIRVQIGWGRLVRVLLGSQFEVPDSEVQELIASQRARQDQAAYLLGEIFIPVDNPAQEGEVTTFVNDVVTQLRRGLPFPVAATQFSQSSTAVQGGDMGWQGLDRLDPAVAAIVPRMPPGAITNPIRVPGGFQIIAMRQRREGGPNGGVTQLTLRQANFPFPGRLDPQNPTEAQRGVVERAMRISQSVRGCEAFEQQGRAGSDRPADPGPVVLEAVNPPQLRSLLAGLTPGRSSQPLISPEGVTLIMVCSRERQAPQGMSADAAREQLRRDRIETLSRQLQRELRRRAVIDNRA